MKHSINQRAMRAAGLLVAAAAVAGGALSASAAASISKELHVGSTGTDVTALQSFLAQDPALYPEGRITGYFGPMTKNAVVNFQLRNEIPSVGRVGPMTLPIINLQMRTGMYPGMGAMAWTQGPDGAVAPSISNVIVSAARNSANVSWTTDQPATGAVYFSSSPLNLSSSLTDVAAIGASSVSTDAALRTAETISLQGLAPNTTYYYMIHVANQSGYVSVSWPSTFRTAN